MHESHERRPETPFANDNDVRVFFPTDNRDEVLNALMGLVQGEFGILIVNGKAGTGKTTVMRVLKERVAAQADVVALTAPLSTTRPLLQTLCRRLGISGSRDRAQSAQRLRKKLVRDARAGRRALLVIDQAERLAPYELAQLDELLSVVLAGQQLLPVAVLSRPTARPIFDHPGLNRLRALVLGEVTLAPFTLAETELFIASEVQAAGLPRELFTPDAVAELHARAQGIPDEINDLAAAALTRIETTHAPQVDAEAIRACGSPETRTTTEPDGTAPLRTTGGLVVPTSSGTNMPSASFYHDRDDLLGRGIIGTTADIEATMPVTTPQPTPIGEMPRALPPRDPEPTAESLVELHRSAARADRLTSLLDSSMLEHAALAERLAATRDRAERATADLARTVEHARGTSVDLERQVDELIEETEQRVEDLRTRLAQAFSELERGEPLRRMREAVTRADDLEARLQRVVTLANDRASRDEEQLRRGERLTVAVESALTAQARIEATLDALARRVDGLSAEPIKQLESTRARWEELRTTIERDHQPMEERIGALQTRIANLPQQIEQIERAVVTEATTRAEATIGERIRDKSRALHELLDRAEVAANRLHDQLASADSAQAKVAGLDGVVREKIHKTEDALRSIEQQANAVHRRVAVDLVADVKRVADEQRESIEQARDELADATNHAIQAARDAVNGSHESAAAAIATAQAELVEVETRAEHLRSSVLADVRREVRSFRETQINTVRHALDQLHKEHESTAAQWRDRVREELAEIEGRAEHVRSVVLADMRREVVSLHETQVGTARRTLDEIRTEHESAAAQWRDRIREELAAGENRFDDLREAILTALADFSDRVEAVRQTTTSDADRVTREMTAVGGMVEQMGFRVDELARRSKTEHAVIDETIATVDTMVARVDDATKRVATSAETIAEAGQSADAALGKAGQLRGEVEALRRDVNSDLVELGRAFERLAPVRETVERGEALAQEVRRLNDEADSASRELSRLLASAGKETASVQEVCALVEQRGRQVDSQSAALQRTLREIHEANVEGRSLVEQTAAASRQIRETVTSGQGAVERLTQDVWSLAATAENRLGELRQTEQRARETLTQLQPLVSSQGSLLGELATHTETAKSQLDALRSQNADTGKLVKRLEAIAAVVRIGGEMRKTLEPLLADSRRLADQLKDLGEAGDERCRELRGLNGSAERILNSHADLATQGESIAASLQASMEGANDTLEAAERLRREFITQAGELSERMSTWTRQAHELEPRIKSALEAPSQVVSQAQSQAAQLEKVCGVVRKVFSALSKGSLEANERTNEFRKISEQATQRVAELTAETQRAAATLHEWVAEAVRVQGRLEKLLQNAPTISATHPVESVNRLGRTVNPAMEPPGGGMHGELRTLGTASRLPVDPTTTARLNPAASRAEQIAAIIEEAKQAAAVVGAGVASAR